MRRAWGAMVLVVTLWPVPSEAGVTVTPVADAMVRYDQPNANFGSASILRAGYSYHREVRSFVRFSLPAGTSGTGRLSIHVQRGNGGTAHVYLVANDSWTEGGITWNNQPALGTRVATFMATPGWHTVTVPVSGGLNSFGFRKYSGAHPGPGPVSSYGPNEVSKWSARESSNDMRLAL